MRFSLIRLSCPLRNKAYAPIGLELLSDKDCKYPPYSTASSRISLRFAVYFSPQFLQIHRSFYHSPLPLLRRKIQVIAEPLCSSKVMLSLPSSLLRTHPPPSRLSVHFVFRLIEPTCSCRFRQGRAGLPQLITPLSIRVAAATPPPPFYFSANFSRRVLPSPHSNRLGQWNSSLTRLPLRSRLLQPGSLLIPPCGALSMGFKRKRFPFPLPSKLRGAGFYHDGTSTH